MSDLLDVLMFRMGGGETFGVDVMNVREIIVSPVITRIPTSRLEVEGMMSLRGVIIPVFSLARMIGCACEDDRIKTMIVFESKGKAYGFLVNHVEKIVSIPYGSLVQSDAVIGGGESISSIATIDDQRLVSVLDFERILNKFAAIEPSNECG